MKNGLLFVNSVLLLGMAAGFIFLFMKVEKLQEEEFSTTLDPASSKTDAGAQSKAPEPDAGEVQALKKRIADLEKTVEKLSEKAADREGEEDPTALAASGKKDDGKVSPPDAPLSRKEVHKLVADQFKKELDKYWKNAQKAAVRPKKTIDVIARELNLTSQQEMEIDNIYRDVSRDMMKVLFNIKNDTELENLKTKLRQAEYDKELKDQLREKASTNWVLNQTKFSLLNMKVDTRLRRILPADVLAKFYKYDVQRKKPEFPDIQKMFWGQKTEEEE
jgi:hypothetical protein